MSDYIKKEDALKAIEVCVNESVMPEEWRSGMLDAYDEVKSYVPSADVVEVVRCKDCKKYMTIHCTCDGCCISDDWYCADGERKDNERF